MVRSFKAYDNIDEVCDKVIFEHEAEGLQEAEFQGKKVKSVGLATNDWATQYNMTL